MVNFNYRASDREGRVQQGSEQAPDLQTAARALREKGLTPILLEPSLQAAAALEGASVGGSTAGLSLLSWFGGSDEKISSAQVLRFTSELGVLLQAGLPLDRALKVQIDAAAAGALQTMAETILSMIKSGKAFTVGLEEYPQVFSGFYVSMVRSGEASGNLPGVLSELAQYLERSRAVRSTIVSALAYPAVLAIVAVLSIALMLGYVVPEFESLFEEMGEGLPWLTGVIVSLGDLVSEWWWLLILSFAALFSVARRWLQMPAGKQWLHDKLLRLPLSGPLINKFEISRFARTMGTLLSNGVPILKASNIAQGTVSNAVIHDSLGSIEPAVRQGERLSKAMSPTIFSPMAIQMVLVGEESGRLDAMLLELAQVYESEVEADVKRMLTLLEPALILGMGGVIAVIIMGILMGILSINTMAF
jgi:general secretion pathway protein F